MITHIRMKNFKSWADSGEVQLAPLTGFFGTNSSGKSSLLQMLLLLKQTAEQEHAEEVIFFGDENSLINLGSFSDLIHNHELETSLELEFGCRLQKTFTIEIFGKNSSGLRADLPVTINNFTFNTSIHTYGQDINVENFRYDFESRDITDIKWEKDRLRYRNLLGESKVESVNVKKCYGVPISGSDEILVPLSSAFEYLFANLYYLGPIRSNPKRCYHWNGKHPKGIDLWNDQAINALLSARVRNLKTVHEENEVIIENRISAWLQQMELAHSFRLGTTGSLEDDNYEICIQKNPTSKHVTLADMGYGLADMLPMLVSCYYVPENSTLILEQPGVHLHPKVQSELADLLIEVVNERNLQILVESHSEHLLTRLQRRIAEKQIDQNNVALYFCRNNEGVSTIEKLDVDSESGDIKNWPENFFGDVMGDMFAMTDKQVESIAKKGTEG